MVWGPKADPWIPKTEMDMDGDVPQEESDEIQRPKRKVIRVETEETQDYVRETLAISRGSGLCAKRLW